MGPQQYLFQKGWRIDAPCQFENKMEWKTKYHAEGYIPCIYIERTVFNFSLNGLHLAPSLIFHILHSLSILEKRIFFNYGKSILCGFLRPCNSRWTVTNHIYQAGFKLREIHLSLPPVCVGGGRIKGIHYRTWPSYGLDFFSFLFDVLWVIKAMYVPVTSKSPSVCGCRSLRPFGYVSFSVPMQYALLMNKRKHIYYFCSQVAWTSFSAKIILKT